MGRATRAQSDEDVKARLRELSRELSEVMRMHGGKSAMVRTFVDLKTGGIMCACNVYGNASHVGYKLACPSIEFREEVE